MHSPQPINTPRPRAQRPCCEPLPCALRAPYVCLHARLRAPRRVAAPSYARAWPCRSAQLRVRPAPARAVSRHSCLPCDTGSLASCSCISQYSLYCNTNFPHSLTASVTIQKLYCNTISIVLCGRPLCPRPRLAIYTVQWQVKFQYSISKA